MFGIQAINRLLRQARGGGAAVNDNNNNDIAAAILGEENDEEIILYHVYMGGSNNQHHMPANVRHVRIHESIKIIPAKAFKDCHRLMSVEFHNGVEIIEEYAFCNCPFLQNVILPGVRIIEANAFFYCVGLTNVVFGNKLEIIGYKAFDTCKSLRHVTIPTCKIIGGYAFGNCEQLIELDLPNSLETVAYCAFFNCANLRRIAIPLKDDITIGWGAYESCPNLTTVNLVAGDHKLISSLHMECWRDEIYQEINRINQFLPTIRGGTTDYIQQWIMGETNRLNRYKYKHIMLLKEVATILELRLWKAKIDETKMEGHSLEGIKAKKEAKIDGSCNRMGYRITSGADVVIKNVLPFLQLE